MQETHSWDGERAARPPGLLKIALEWRAPWEYLASMLSQGWLTQLPQGDGHPVLLFPGFMASDASTAPLRRFLERKGYVAVGWGLGSNFGPRDGVLERCSALLRDLRRRHRRKVSLIGWSLGGIYARELAKQHARDVRQVITLGTPFTGHPKATNVWRLYEIVAGHRIGAPTLHAPLRAAPPVPTTSIYSRTDGVVAWQCSLEKPGPTAENIEIEASHCGLGVNPLAWLAIADRLAQADGKWRPFDRAHAGRSWLFRDPARAGWF